MPQSIRQQLNAVENQRAEYVGTAVSLSVQMGDDTLRFQRIRKAIQDNPDIPAAWTPRTRNRLRMYLECVNRLKNSTSLKHFEEFSDEFPFPARKHQGYLGQRTEYIRDSKYPVTHQILHLKEGDELNEFNQASMEAAGAIPIRLERTKGSAETDDTTSEFALHFPKDTPQEYMPFIMALQKMFAKRLNHYYDSGAVRKLMTETLLLRMNAEQAASFFLIDGAQVDALNAMSKTFNELHHGIKVFSLHTYRYPDLPDEHPANESFRSMAEGISQSLVKDLKEFFDDVRGKFEDSETNTRVSTWKRRRDEFHELRKRVEKYRSREMLMTDIIDDYIDKSRDVIKHGLLDSEA